MAINHGDLRRGDADGAAGGGGGGCAGGCGVDGGGGDGTWGTACVSDDNAASTAGVLGAGPLGARWGRRELTGTSSGEAMFWATGVSRGVSWRGANVSSTGRAV